MKKEEQAQQTKTKFLDAALTVIRGKGYAATTIDDLCAEAGVTKGAFFHYFKSKEDLAVSAAEYWSTTTNEFFRQAPYHRPSDPLERVLGYVDFRKKILLGEVPEFTCLVGTMVQEAYESNPAIREACKKSIFGHAADVAKDIEDAKQKYVPGAKWSAESLALYTQAAIQGAFILAKAKGSSDIAADCIDHLRCYIEMLFDRKPSSPKQGEKK